MSRSVRMKVIPKPKDGTAAVFIKKDPTDFIPYIEGENGSYNYLCGKCNLLLIKNVNPDQIGEGIVLHCPKCGEYNCI